MLLQRPSFKKCSHRAKCLGLVCTLIWQVNNDLEGVKVPVMVA